MKLNKTKAVILVLLAVVFVLGVIFGVALSAVVESEDDISKTERSCGRSVLVKILFYPSRSVDNSRKIIEGNVVIFCQGHEMMHWQFAFSAFIKLILLSGNI